MALAAALDRRSIVSRHDVRLNEIDPDSPLSVGNGEFAFTVDVTGLQSLPAVYEKTVPLCTQAQWGWHSFPIPGGLSPADLRLEVFDTYGREVGYATSSKGQEPLFNWLRENPHRLNLARIGFLLDGQPLTPSDIGEIEQTLRLWDGAIESRFRLRGAPVRVRTECHETRDAIAVSVDSPLAPGRLAIAFDFPYGSPDMAASDWNSAAKHKTEVVAEGRGSMNLRRQLDSNVYYARLDWRAGASVSKVGIIACC